jgi:hypothetical protein
MRSYVVSVANAFDATSPEDAIGPHPHQYVVVGDGEYDRWYSLYDRNGRKLPFDNYSLTDALDEAEVYLEWT